MSNKISNSTKTTTKTKSKNNTAHSKSNATHSKNNTTHNSLSYFPTTQLYNEDIRKQPITQADKNKTLSLFSNFYIEPPSDFEAICSSLKTYGALENWRRNYIVKKLGEKKRF